MEMRERIAIVIVFWVIAVMMRRKDVQEGESELFQPHMHMIYLEKRYTGDCRRI